MNIKVYCEGSNIPQRKPKKLAEAILLASDVLGCAAYQGSWFGDVQHDGDCSVVSIKGMDRRLLQPGFVWAGDTATMLHESIPLLTDCERTVVRINVQGWIQ